MITADDERVVWTGRPSWRGRMSIVAPGLLLALAVLVGGLLLDVSTTIVLLVAVVIAVATVAWALLETIRWKYTVTERRVFVRHGLISVNEQTARLERVQDLTLRQSLFDRLFGVGTLKIDTAGSEGGALEFKALRSPAEVRELLDATIRRERHEGV
ncbi:MAG TPA: PH domain-containing protein [Gaiellaceae bacterium]|nr:PH domain-containing protein [Gaiellaceae bacterium]